MLYAIVVCACLILVTLFWMVKPNYFFASTVGIPVFFRAVSVVAGNFFGGQK
jgi:hypothetical protein